MDEVFSPIELSEEYKVGIAAIDREHEFLIGLYNGLVAAVKSGNARDMWDDAFQKLVEYADQHFTNEEQLMASRHFPGYDNHKRQHMNFVGSLNQLATERAGQDEEHALILLLIFVGQWIRGHILVTDKELGEFAGQG
jgi:hemerythrin